MPLLLALAVFYEEKNIFLNFDGALRRKGVTMSFQRIKIGNADHTVYPVVLGVWKDHRELEDDFHKLRLLERQSVMCEPVMGPNIPMWSEASYFLVDADYPRAGTANLIILTPYDLGLRPVRNSYQRPMSEVINFAFDLNLQLVTPVTMAYFVAQHGNKLSAEFRKSKILCAMRPVLICGTLQVVALVFQQDVLHHGATYPDIISTETSSVENYDGVKRIPAKEQTPKDVPVGLRTPILFRVREN